MRDILPAKVESHHEEMRDILPAEDETHHLAMRNMLLGLILQQKLELVRER